jgi:hypothetical protein
MRRQRHLSGHGELATTDKPDVGHGVVRDAARPRGDPGGLVASQTRDAVNVGGLDGLVQGHVRQHRRQPAR